MAKNESFVVIEKSITEKRRGCHYAGQIRTFGCDLDYDLKFAVPIIILPSLPNIENAESVRVVFQLSLQNNTQPVSLSNDEYEFFLRLLLPYAVELYNRSLDESESEARVTAKEACEVAGLDVPDFYMLDGESNSNCIYGVSRYMWAVLNSPKFSRLAY